MFLASNWRQYPRHLCPRLNYPLRRLQLQLRLRLGCGDEAVADEDEAGVVGDVQPLVKVERERVRTLDPSR